jgi:hypothetical protein
MTIDDSRFSVAANLFCTGRAKEYVVILPLETYVRGIRTRCYGVNQFPHVVTFPWNSPEYRTRSEEILHS